MELKCLDIVFLVILLIQHQECSHLQKVNYICIISLFTYIPYSLLLLFHNLGGKIQISNSTNMILDMQGGFSTKERGGVDVKVSTGCSIYEWDTNTFQIPIVKYIHLNLDIANESVIPFLFTISNDSLYKM